MSLAFELTPHPSPVDTKTRARILSNPGFGKHFTDHMITIRWTAEAGWHDAQLMPRGPFQIDPAASVLHYAQEIFEGMKAYRGTDGRIRMFRPQENARRFNQSAMRMAMPEIPEDIFLDAVGRLVTADEDWIPAGSGSLYLRPFMFADDAFLGVRPASSYIFCIIACPVGAYFKGGDSAIRLWVTPDYIRAAPGGTGAAKCGGNYAGSLVAQRQAIAQDCDQVLFLDAIEGRWVEELGGMNIFFVFDDHSIITPPLRGTILPGITRASLLTIAADLGMTISEQPYSFSQWEADAASGRLREAFACGTAAVVAGIGTVASPTGQFTIGEGTTGSVTTMLRDALMNVQRGETPDRHRWVYSLS
ncbi:branched-chain amino acid aminotransferase [Sphingobium sp. AP50]|uniref:branched-chain amino acid aminotransferase n=1 Tax=Sphingobium sp. AP50 TaxID=1884369 RepID=UPI0008AEE46F|nr:branched-chain amino acid aminotransferase [Sphingobium sp. AP50]SEJ94992.1 branched-chain amino acid aminotransferase [Sphingobium sp. AP50]